MEKFTLLALSFLMLISCGETKSQDVKSKTNNESAQIKIVKSFGSDTTFTFENCETNKIPNGWSQYYTGKSHITDWQIVDDNGNKVLAQLSEEDVSGHFNEVVYNGIITKNVVLDVKLKGIKGERDQGGGFVWRFFDADNHYIVRANPLEDNVVLYKMENGVRTDLPLVGKGKTYGVDVPKLGSGWNNLKLTVIDDLFTVYLNDREIFQVKDSTFSKAGKIGLWTKADAVTYFDEFEVKMIK
jgi:hypothetical protein